MGPPSGPHVPRSKPEKLEPLWMVRAVPEPLSTKTEAYCPACGHRTVGITSHGSTQRNEARDPPGSTHLGGLTWPVSSHTQD